MKSSQFFKLLLVCFAVALATSAFAANGIQKGNFQVSEPLQVNGTQLPAGEYVAKWEGTGESVKVEISHNGKVVTTVPAKVVDLTQKADQNASEVSEVNGRRELNALRFSGKKVQLDLGTPAAEAHGIK